MGAIAWWGSSSHFDYGGGAFFRGNGPEGIATALLGGRTLGEALAYEGTGSSGLVFGDPLYRPFPPGKVAVIDTVAPPQPATWVTEEITDPSERSVAIHWSIAPPTSDPDLAIASLEHGPTTSFRARESL